jgi:hypothetical protein
VKYNIEVEKHNDRKMDKMADRLKGIYEGSQVPCRDAERQNGRQVDR